MVYIQACICMGIGECMDCTFTFCAIIEIRCFPIEGSREVGHLRKNLCSGCGKVKIDECI